MIAGMIQLEDITIQFQATWKGGDGGYEPTNKIQYTVSEGLGAQQKRHLL